MPKRQSGHGDQELAVLMAQINNDTTEMEDDELPVERKRAILRQQREGARNELQALANQMQVANALKDESMKQQIREAAQRSRAAIEVYNQLLKELDHTASDGQHP